MAKYETIDEAFANMHESFRPQQTGLTHVYQFIITGWGNRILTIQDSTMQLEDGTHPNPDVTVKANRGDYLSIVNGEVELNTAYMLGMIAVEGTLEDAEKLAYFFPRPSEELNQKGSKIIPVR